MVHEVCGAAGMFSFKWSLQTTQHASEVQAAVSTSSVLGEPEMSEITNWTSLVYHMSLNCFTATPYTNEVQVCTSHLKVSL